jgi:uncharacterized membrane protein YgdD (TMEM256/DUF423 family)
MLRRQRKLAGFVWSDIGEEVTTGHDRFYTGADVGRRVMARVWVAIGAIFGLTTVAMAAYQAHGLAGSAASSVASAVQMQGLHALALLCVALLAERRGGVVVHFAGLAFTLGVILFCGTVYSGAIPVIEFLHIGRLAPIGGTILMVGWVLVFISATRR